MDWFDALFEDSTVKTYEFTKRAVKKIGDIASADLFHELDDPKKIYYFLFQEAKIIPFCDYLKRYIYCNAELEQVGHFSEISNDVYKDIIIETFRENKVPFSFESSTERKNAIINGWLTKNVVSRTTVFLIAFGLGMTADDAKIFLTKVLKEEDFIFTDIKETIIWFCLCNNLTFSKAKELIEKYTSVKEGIVDDDNANLINPADICNENDLDQYIHYLLIINKSGQGQQNAYKVFTEMYNVLGLKLEIINSKLEKLGEADIERNANSNYSVLIERALYSGLKVNDHGNLPKASESSLFKQFDGKRLSRQRINYIIGHKGSIERFDLITLKFLQYALEAEEKEELSLDRMAAYVDDTDKVLESCGMHGIYPVNPYEAFILLCLLSEFPLTEYNDVLSISYNGEEAWLDER